MHNRRCCILAVVHRTKKLRLFTYSIIGYMMLAFIWWAVLLYTKNEDAFQAKAELLKIGLVAEQIVDNKTSFEKHPSYLELRKTYDRQVYMILAEGLVFILTLVAGIYLINRSYRKEVESVKQQRNFLLSITHELKSPLAAIRLSLDTLKKRDLNLEMKNKVTSIGLQETSRLTSLVEDLLLSSKLDTSYKPNLEPIDLKETAEAWINQMQIKYAEFTFNLTCEGDEFMILADHNGINSIFSNLLENAVKYRGDCTTFLVKLKEKEDSLQISFLDYGVGISNFEKKKVKNKFYRVGNEDTRKTKGSGLGLYIVDKVVEAHAGNLTIQDNQPKGTIFTVTFPFGQTD